MDFYRNYCDFCAEENGGVPLCAATCATGTLSLSTAPAVGLVVAVGFVANTGIGNLSSVGWGDISLLCPLGALMSLLGKVNSRTLRPTVDKSKCIESGCKTCGRCAAVCEVGIDLRHPERGAGVNECLKCRECIESCPAHAITMPLLPKKTDVTSAGLSEGER